MDPGGPGSGGPGNRSNPPVAPVGGPSSYIVCLAGGGDIEPGNKQTKRLAVYCFLGKLLLASVSSKRKQVNVAK